MFMSACRVAASRGTRSVLDAMPSGLRSAPAVVASARSQSSVTGVATGMCAHVRRPALGLGSAAPQPGLVLRAPSGVPLRSAHSSTHVHQLLLDNNFMIDRPLFAAFGEGYGDTFGKEFWDTLFSLGAGDQLWDMGAGSARFLQDYAMTCARTKSPCAQMTAVAVAKPAHDQRLAQFEEQYPSFRYLCGYIEEMPDLPVGTVQMIVDMFGPLSYTDRLSEVLQRNMRMLAVGGSLWVCGRDGIADIRLDPASSDAASRMDVLAWLSTIDGLDVQECKDLPMRSSYRITKTKEAVDVPRLTLHSLQEDAFPPFRVFTRS